MHDDGMFCINFTFELNKLCGVGNTWMESLVPKYKNLFSVYTVFQWKVDIVLCISYHGIIQKYYHIRFTIIKNLAVTPGIIQIKFVFLCLKKLQNFIKHFDKKWISFSAISYLYQRI